MGKKENLYNMLLSLTQKINSKTQHDFFIFLQKCHSLFNGWLEFENKELINKKKMYRSIQLQTSIMKKYIQEIFNNYNKLRRYITITACHWNFLLQIQVI